MKLETFVRPLLNSSVTLLLVFLLGTAGCLTSRNRIDTHAVAVSMDQASFGVSSKVDGENCARDIPESLCPVTSEYTLTNECFLLGSSISSDNGTFEIPLGVHLNNHLPFPAKRVLRKLSQNWGVYDGGGYWRIFNKKPIEFYDINASWHTNENVLVLHYRFRSDYLALNCSYGRRYTINSDSRGNCYVTKADGEEAIDMLMTPSNIIVYAWQGGGRNGWIDFRGIYYPAGTVIPHTPTGEEIEAFRKTYIVPKLDVISCSTNINGELVW